MNVKTWLKGNTHMHSTRSDGTATVQELVEWYHRLGYDFIAITDHNRYLQEYEIQALRLPPGFILLNGSELSYKSEVTMKPVDVCDVGGYNVDPPGHAVVFVKGGPTETAESAISSATGIPVLNHPCWRWPMTADDIIAIKLWHLLEIWNPSSDCNSYTIHGVDSPENMWDKVLSAGKKIWAVSADDAHGLPHGGVEWMAGGRLAWIRVGAKERTAEAIMEAMRDGNFYCTTGVELEELNISPRVYQLRVAQFRDRQYAIHFIGHNGKELQVVNGTLASYSVRGDEGYVRVRIVDTMGCMCWTQPLFVT
jgi:alkanesulfonate monooxygenase SsuD/methylene tetrahydromethanopterin reductase-like flavin-dependent oxidoreductase (luciferase family)